MTKENLETKIKKAVISIEKRVAGIYDVLCALSLQKLGTHSIFQQIQLLRTRLLNA